MYDWFSVLLSYDCSSETKTYSVWEELGHFFSLFISLCTYFSETSYDRICSTQQVCEELGHICITKPFHKPVCISTILWNTLDSPSHSRILPVLCIRGFSCMSMYFLNTYYHILWPHQETSHVYVFQMHNLKIFLTLHVSEEIVPVLSF